ncbi:hypothetical protein BCR35DRAFT_311186 [Leucosporidium creatinivorum]|uniref:Uncharacterized protein n=1 Tax=Leucosporidium creatinivorum TaxID=106004 RepID=A0A1Y2CC83_9BASI|nr:hypothetical protein BCR35DRAFT_311186 [Leucosporidium creatinivorum]
MRRRKRGNAGGGGEGGGIGWTRRRMEEWRRWWRVVEVDGRGSRGGLMRARLTFRCRVQRRRRSRWRRVDLHIHRNHRACFECWKVVASHLDAIRRLRQVERRGNERATGNGRAACSTVLDVVGFETGGLRDELVRWRERRSLMRDGRFVVAERMVRRGRVVGMGCMYSRMVVLAGILHPLCHSTRGRRRRPIELREPPRSLDDVHFHLLLLLGRLRFSGSVIQNWILAP